MFWTMVAPLAAKAKKDKRCFLNWRRILPFLRNRLELELMQTMFPIVFFVRTLKFYCLRLHFVLLLFTKTWSVINSSYLLFSKLSAPLFLLTNADRADQISILPEPCVRVLVRQNSDSFINHYKIKPFHQTYCFLYFPIFKNLQINHNAGFRT